jgi:hypothetical protein
MKGPSSLKERPAKLWPVCAQALVSTHTGRVLTTKWIEECLLAVKKEVLLRQYTLKN